MKRLVSAGIAAWSNVGLLAWSGLGLLACSSAAIAQQAAPAEQHKDHANHAGHGRDESHSARGENHSDHGARGTKRNAEPGHAEPGDAEPGHAEPDHAGHAPPDAPSASDAPTQSELEHIPPDPPRTELNHAMTYEEMAALMQMDDRARFSKVMLDRVEWRDAKASSPLEWDISAWYGSDYDKLWLKSEGERRDGSTEAARIELLWDRIFTRWWSLQAGARRDFGDGPFRTWAALGVQGLAPYFFEVEATAYVSEQGRTAARLSAEYDLLLTQRLILQPEAELNWYGKDDPERRIGSGVSDVQVGLRLRYEFRREFAPYLGIVWTRRFGKSAVFARDAGEDPSDLQALAGLRMWF